MNDSIVRTIARTEVDRALAYANAGYDLTTTDATPTIITTIDVVDYSGGFIEVEVLGVETTGTGKITGKQIVGFFKDATLTLDAPDILHDQDSIGASWQVVNDSDNIAIEVTGVAATDIDWTVNIYQVIKQASNVP